MLLELAIADAYSAGLVNRTLEFVVAHNDLSNYEKPCAGEGPPGHYTGITQSNIAIAKMLVLNVPWVTDFLANSFVTTFKQDPRKGYSDNFYKSLQQVADGSELVDGVEPYNNKDNPAARAMAVGILSTPEQVIKASITHAAITSNTPDSLNASIAVALMSHYFIYGLGKKKQLKDFIDIYIDTKWLQPGQTVNRNLLVTQQAIDLTIKHDSLSQLLQHCVTLADGDLISAIAVAGASSSKEYQQDLPQCLVDNLENSDMYGRDFLLSLDNKWRNLSN